MRRSMFAMFCLLLSCAVMPTGAFSQEPSDEEVAAFERLLCDYYGTMARIGMRTRQLGYEIDTALVMVDKTISLSVLGEEDIDQDFVDFLTSIGTGLVNAAYTVQVVEGKQEKEYIESEFIKRATAPCRQN